MGSLYFATVWVGQSMRQCLNWGCFFVFLMLIMPIYDKKFMEHEMYHTVRWIRKGVKIHMFENFRRFYIFMFISQLCYQLQWLWSSRISTPCKKPDHFDSKLSNCNNLEWKSNSIARPTLNRTLLQIWYMFL